MTGEWNCAYTLCLHKNVRTIITGYIAGADRLPEVAAILTNHTRAHSITMATDKMAT